MIDPAEFARSTPGVSSFPPVDAAREGDGAADAVAPATEEAAVASASSEQPYGVSLEVTPARLAVYYQAGPKRLYRVRKLTGVKPVPFEDLIASAQEDDDGKWDDVPSVTTVLGVIDSSGPLIWWGQGIGALGVLRMIELGVDMGLVEALIKVGALDDARKSVCDLLTSHEISTNHVRDAAGDRGVNVHSAFEQWANDQRITPQPIVFAEHERGYVEGLAAFLKDLSVGEPTDIHAEVTVASRKRKFAGRYDVRFVLQKPCPIITRITPVRPPKIEEIPAGRYMGDVKTSKDVFDKHYLQMEGYEGASLECGYEPTDYRGVIHVTKDGRYEFHVNQLKNPERPWDYDDFLVTRELYRVMNEVKRR